MKAYSIDLRQRVLEDCDAVLGTREVATKYRVSESWVRRLKQRRRETGEVAPRRAGTRKPAKWLAYAEQLRQLVEETPDATLEELRERLGRPVSTATVCRALQVLRLTFKKKSCAPLSRTDRMLSSVVGSGKPR